MCYRTKLTAPGKKIQKTFGASFIEPEKYQLKEEINGFSFAPNPVVTDESRGEIQMFYWGLIPFWAKDDSIRKATLNSRIETAEEKPAFRNSVENRCLIIADGYYEWQWLDPKGNNKQKYLIRPIDQEVFAFAGIYSSWINPENKEQINSYSILTTEANDLMSEIHNNKKRMPVVLKAGDHSRYLDGAGLKDFAFPYDVRLAAEKVK